MPFFIDITVIRDAFYLRFFASTSITGMLKAWELTAIATGSEVNLSCSEVNLTCSRTVQVLAGAIAAYGAAWTQIRQYLRLGQASRCACNCGSIRAFIFDCSSCNGRKEGPKPTDTKALHTHHADPMQWRMT